MTGFCFHCLTFFSIQFLTAFPLSWILLSLLYSNPLPNCLLPLNLYPLNPSVSELGYLPFNPLIGFLPSDLFASSKCNLTLPATTYPDCSLPIPPLHLPALPTFGASFSSFQIILCFISFQKGGLSSSISLSVLLLFPPCVYVSPFFIASQQG